MSTQTVQNLLKTGVYEQTPLLHLSWPSTSSVRMQYVDNGGLGLLTSLQRSYTGTRRHEKSIADPLRTDNQESTQIAYFGG